MTRVRAGKWSFMPHDSSGQAPPTGLPHWGCLSLVAQPVPNIIGSALWKSREKSCKWAPNSLISGFLRVSMLSYHTQPLEVVTIVADFFLPACVVASTNSSRAWPQVKQSMHPSWWWVLSLPGIPATSLPCNTYRVKCPRKVMVL